MDVKQTLNNPIKVIHVDDAKLFRDGLESLFKYYPNIQIIGGAENGLELFKILKISDPDVILLDVEMPVMGGHETLLLLKEKYPLIKIIVLSTYYDTQLILEFFKSGSSAYFHKNIDVEILVEAIEMVHIEGEYLDKRNTMSLIQSATILKPKRQLIGLKMLDEDEKKVLSLMGEGLSGKQIAVAMNISASMVNKHKINIKSKTKSKNVAEMIMNGVWNGIIPVFKTET